MGDILIPGYWNEWTEFISIYMFIICLGNLILEYYKYLRNEWNGKENKQ